MLTCINFLILDRRDGGVAENYPRRGTKGTKQTIYPASYHPQFQNQ